jgi:AcrR family transcriptional regulator
MPRPRRAPQDPLTTERLLAAAAHSFGELGYGRARLEDIAGAAGITRPSLLYHFPSKESLYAAVVQRAFSQLGDALASAMGSDIPFESAVDGIVNNYEQFLADNPGIAAIVLRELVDGQGPGRRLLLQEIVPLLDAVEHFAEHAGAGVLPEGLPVRAAISQLAASMLLYAAAPDLRHALWGGQQHALTMARSVFLRRPA